MEVAVSAGLHNKIIMQEQFTHYVGIDVSKLTLNIAICDSSRQILEEYEIENLVPAIKSMLVKLKKIKGFDVKNTIFCLEHTGNYCTPFLEASDAKSLNTWMENPTAIKRSLGIVRGKSDQADARQIAVYACRFIDKAKLWKRPPHEIAELRALFSERNRLVKVIGILTVPIREAAQMGNKVAAGTGKFSEKAVKELVASKVSIEERIAEIVAEVPEIQQNMELLKSIKGIGRETAVMLIVFTQNFTLFANAKQFACFCGVAPFPHSSGTSVKGKTKISRMGNRIAKALLTTAAWSASRFDLELKTYHQRRVAEGVEPMASINIIRNKLLGRAFSVIRRQERFQVDWNPEAKRA